MYRRYEKQRMQYSRRSAAVPTTADIMETMNQWNRQWAESWGTAMGPWLDLWNNAMSPWLEWLEPWYGQPRHRHDRDCDCDECRHGEHHHHDCDDCGCDCCIQDADLVVYSRVGERHIVPIRLENNRRRDREVTLDLSKFSSSSATAIQPVGAITPTGKITLAQCAEQQVLLLVTVPATTGQDNTPVEVGREGTTPVANLADVDQCRVFTADLRVEGCDMRPLRIAVVVLPRNCDEYELDCHGGCC